MLFRKKLSIRHLRLVDVLGKTLSISSSADALHTSQSAVSRGLREIEELLGATLFDRTTRRLTPTAFGRNLMRHADQILNQLDHAEADFFALMEGRHDRINVGLMGGVSPSVIGRAVKLMEQRNPDVSIRFHSNFAQPLVNDLFHNRCDLIISHFDIGDFDRHDELSVTTLYFERLAVMAGADHPLQSKASIDWSDLAREQWVIVPAASSLRRMVEHKLLTHNVSQVRFRIETIEMQLVIELVRHANMITALPRHSVEWMQNELGQMRKLPLVDDGLAPWPICAATLASKEPTAASRAFIECLKEASAVVINEADNADVVGLDQNP